MSRYDQRNRQLPVHFGESNYMHNEYKMSVLKSFKMFQLKVVKVISTACISTQKVILLETRVPRR